MLVGGPFREAKHYGDSIEYGVPATLIATLVYVEPSIRFAADLFRKPFWSICVKMLNVAPILGLNYGNKYVIYYS